MSRIGKKPLEIPEKVQVKIEAGKVFVTGPKGSLDFCFHQEIEVKMTDKEIICEKVGKSKNAPALWGTTARIIQNMMEGVTKGFEKKLELNGVGFRMALQGKKLNMALGFSHPVILDVPEGIEAKIEGNAITISGIDKQAVGQFAAKIKSLKPVEPYKGKGFKYAGEIVRRKEGKKAAAK